MFVLPSFLLLKSLFFIPVRLGPLCNNWPAWFFAGPLPVITLGFFLSSTPMQANPATAKDAGRTDPVKKVANAEPFFDTDMILRMLADLDQRSTGNKLDIAVGSFNYENTELQSSFSALLSHEMEVGLVQSGKVNVISRKGMADMQGNGLLSFQKNLEPGASLQKDSPAWVKAILRGRFYPSANGVKVDAELAWLESGKVKKTHLDIPAGKVMEKMGGDTSAAKSSVSSAIQPENIQQSLDNVKQIVTDRFEKIPKNFPVEIFTGDGKRAYVAGESIRFRVRSAEDCHITVICHQSDGESVVLFPNRWCRDTLVHANETIEIPGTANHFKMRIGPPFGSDVVEVIACSQESEIHKKFAQNPTATDDQHPFQIVNRGIIVEGIDSVLSDQKSSTASACRWGRDHIIISTFP